MVIYIQEGKRAVKQQVVQIEKVKTWKLDGEEKEKERADIKKRTFSEVWEGEMQETKRKLRHGGLINELDGGRVGERVGVAKRAPSIATFDFLLHVIV